MYFYTKDHLFLYMENDTVTIHLSQYAVKKFMGITSINLPQLGGHYQQGEAIFDFESPKLVAAIASPCAGTIYEVNSQLAESLIALNTNPEQNGWICKMQLDANNDFSKIKLMTPAQYAECIEKTVN